MAKQLQQADPWDSSMAALTCYHRAWSARNSSLSPLTRKPNIVQRDTAIPPRTVGRMDALFEGRQDTTIWLCYVFTAVF